ncbi:MAG: cobaltochelatase subunit CobN [Isosphaeraceae bacterium]
MTSRQRVRVLRPDGKQIYLLQKRAHLFVCAKGCCCGRTDRGNPAVPVDFYKKEYARRKLRQRVQLTMSGCIGPCPMMNAVLLVFDGHSVWFQSINSEPQVGALYDHVDAMLAADSYLPPPPELSDYVFDYYAWNPAATPPVPSAGPTSPTGAHESGGVLFLSHADTDLLSLDRALRELPEGFVSVHALSLGKVKSDDHMRTLLAGHGRSARLVVARILGSAAGVPGFRDLVESARASGQHLIVVSGSGGLDPELTASSTVSPAVVHEASAYLQAGGSENLAQLLRFLSDHLLMTGFGYEPPRELPQHGVYHPDLARDATLADWLARSNPSAPTVGLLFYRAHWMSGNVAFIDAMVRAIEARGANVLPIHTASLKQAAGAAADGSSSRWPAAFDFFLGPGRPRIDVLVSTMSFAMGDLGPQGLASPGWSAGALEALDVPILQAITAGSTRWQWEVSTRGLNPLDTAMNVALPEFDGRIITVPISFKEPVGRSDESPDSAGLPGGPPAGIDAVHYAPVGDRIDRVAGLAIRCASLRRKPNAEKRVAFILTNSSGKAAKIGNAVGLDAPASLLRILEAMRESGYTVEGLPSDGDELIQDLIDRCSYDTTFLTESQLDGAAGRVAPGDYQAWFDGLPEAQRELMVRQWGEPPGEAFVHDGRIALAGREFGNVFVGLQPPRGYGMDPAAIYHQPDLPPTHHYHAFYRWLRDAWGADAIVHVGKHGTLEWLPGKGIGLSSDCFPDALLADLPLIYPFIVNDPGEGAQAKRRGHAVVIDHLVPPLTTADGYGVIAELAQLVDEYYQVESLDPSKLPILQQQIWDLIQQGHLEEDLKYVMRQDHGDHTHEWDEGTTPDGTPMTLANMRGREFAHMIEDLDAYLCELTGAQIRDGLHILGEAPSGESMVGMLQAVTRLPSLEAPSLRAGLAGCFGLDAEALLDDLGARLEPEPRALAEIAGRRLATRGDAVEAIDELARHLLTLLESEDFEPGSVGRAIEQGLPGIDGPGDVRTTLEYVCRDLVPALQRTSDEIANLLHALDGGHVPAGPSGAPTRGMVHVLPTGRNFYTVDPRAVPSTSAWRIGQELARETIRRFLDETGAPPETVGISMWGTSAMRTQGDDVAQVLALLGVRPVWQRESRRLLGVEPIPLEELGRPRVDVVMRISGFFRDAFPHLIQLLDEAVGLVAHLDEPTDRNFIRKHYLAEMEASLGEDACETTADRRARYRIFGSKPGSYGAGILPLIDERNWRDDADLAEAYVNWGGYAYTADEQGVDARDVFRLRLGRVQVALHNQDNREHDILDSDDYFQFHGGMIATIRALTGRKPRHYFGDTHDPSRPRVRDLKSEVLRVFRSRVVNPKWLESITRHGYKGGLELNATVDYLFGFGATAGVVDDWMYEDVAKQYALDPEIRRFLERSNPWALHAIAERLLEAGHRGLWAQPAPETLAALRQTLLDSEAVLEARGEPVGSAGGRGPGPAPTDERR